MSPELEKYLWDRTRIYGVGRTPREVINEMMAQKMIQTEKQAWRTLEKWMRKDLYEFGVSLDLGWRIR